MVQRGYTGKLLIQRPRKYKGLLFDIRGKCRYLPVRSAPLCEYDVSIVIFLSTRYHCEPNCKTSIYQYMSSSIANTPRDIVIIGGGIIGCSTAYYLSRHPSFSPSSSSIKVVEASKDGPAQGASGKAGGLVAKWGL